jgi:hypothetical protein
MKIEGGFHLVNVAREGAVDRHWEEKIVAACAQDDEIAEKLRGNYTCEGLDLENHLTFDALIDESGRVVTFCGVYNGGRYPEGVFRLLNRTYVHPDYRVGNRRFPGITSKWIVPRQLELFRHRIRFGFISREGIGARHFMNRWVKSHAPDPGWRVSQRLAHVSPRGRKKNAFQYIAYKSYEPNVGWPLETVSESEWLALEDG